MRSKKILNGVLIETEIREFASCNILEAEVGTNGYCGGDTGHGSRTYLRITNLAATDMTVSVDKGKYGIDNGVEISLGGDTELETFIEALEFVVEHLKEHAHHGETV